MKSKIIGLVFACALINGCATTLKPTELNAETGEFETSFKISYNGIKTNKAFDQDYLNLAYVKTDEKSEQYNNFFFTSVKNMNKFKEVKQKSEMEQMVFQKKLSTEVSSVSDLVGLHNLQKHIGKFVIIEPYVEWKGGYNFFSSLKVIDPETGDTVLHLENEAFNWAGLDQPLFYPLLNGLLQWIEGREIPTEEKPGSKKNKK